MDEQSARKYFTEMGLSLFTEGSCVFRPSVLPHFDRISPDARSVIDDASIYFVCAKPRVRINPDSIKQDSTYLQFELNLHTVDGIEATQVDVPNFFLLSAETRTVQVSETLSFYLELVHKNGTDRAYLPVDNFVRPDAFHSIDAT